MQPRIILDKTGFELTIKRLCFELIEEHNDFSNSALIGIQPRGKHLARRICTQLSKILGNKDILNGNIDVTFFRDDFRRRENPLVPQSNEIDFIVENKKVILIDDVLYTGRTARAALDAILAFGRPAEIDLLVLIDRRFTRHLPIQPDYTGKSVDSIASDEIKVNWKEMHGEDKVYLYSS